MNKTNIEWCDSSWNPITGCLHGCEYCYARGIANRFRARKGYVPLAFVNSIYEKDGFLVLDEPAFWRKGSIEDGNESVKYIKNPYPRIFEPTFHRYRLDEYKKKMKPRTIFVGSMADVFGEWVPDEWIHEVFKACEAAPQHRYLFLTKNPKRYGEFGYVSKENYWYGITMTCREDKARSLYLPAKANRFFSIEPIQENLDLYCGDGVLAYADWVIIGAETGNRKDKVIPKREWIENIVEQCDRANVPVFMKDSLIPIMSKENMRREFPWETE